MAENWTTVIKPRNKLFEIDLKEIWQYRDLLQMFIKRDIITQYKQTILGPTWFFIQPLMTTLMYMIIFGGIAGISTDGLPQPLFYLSGICMWNYFSECLNKTSNTFINNAGIFGKVYFPRLIVPLSIVISNLVRFGIQVILFVLVYLYYVLFTEVNVHPNIYILLLPVLVLMMAGMGFGFGVLISSLTTKYRDLTVLFTFIIQLWMYATPIIYPLSMMSEKKQLIMSINPITPIIESFKYASLGQGMFSWGALGYSFGFMCILVVVGVVMFNRVQRSYMDTV